MKYRKKPVVIDAEQLSRKNANEVADWCGGQYKETEVGAALFIETLEGTMRADFGDWVIRGVKGEFYPCKPDIFEAIYELAE